jgi:ribonuclease P protein component
MKGLYSYNKKEKLKSRKLIEELFAKGRPLSAFPLKVFFVLLPSTAEQTVQAGVGVSARHFKKAVHRNRIKRLLREGYRLNKETLHTVANEQHKKLAVFFLYTGKELPDFTLINEKMRAALTKLTDELKR